LVEGEIEELIQSLEQQQEEEAAAAVVYQGSGSSAS
jgi:hypothetical protein